MDEIWIALNQFCWNNKIHKTIIPSVVVYPKADENRMKSLWQQFDRCKFEDIHHHHHQNIVIELSIHLQSFVKITKNGPYRQCNSIIVALLWYATLHSRNPRIDWIFPPTKTERISEKPFALGDPAIEWHSLYFTIIASWTLVWLLIKYQFKLITPSSIR